MGISNRASLHALKLALLVAAVLVGLVATAPAAHALELGISDSDAPTVTEPLWDGLHVSRARVVVPYDLAITLGAAGTQLRTSFEAYRANAAAKGVSLLVSFAPSADTRAPGTGDPVAPSADEFAVAFAAFRQKYPDVRTIAPWNEPNNSDASHYALGASPRLAADYWLRAKALCPIDCTLVAGDFAGVVGDDAYVDAYQSELGAARPDVWAFHAHGDVNDFQAAGPTDARVSRYYLHKLQGPWAGSQVWIDEVGARYRDASGVVWGDGSQQRATEFVLGLATIDPRISAIYYYNYSNQCSQPSTCAIQDRGLVSPNPFDGSPPDYDGANRARAAYDVIAGGGPVIAPSPPVPPLVTIDRPVQSASLRTPAALFSGRAATVAAPSITLQIYPGAGSTQASTPLQTLTAAVASGRWSATTKHLADGVYTARASQAGDAGDAGFSQNVVFSIDTVAPKSTIGGGPGASTGARSARFSLVASEPGAAFRCSVDGHTSKACTSPVRLSGLAVGAHSLTVRATDRAGNPQAVPAKRSWRVVSLATALVPRTATLTRALPIAATCADACKLEARLYVPRGTARSAGLRGSVVSRRDPLRPSGSGYVGVAGATVTRARGGAAALALRLHVASAGRLSRTGRMTARLGIVLTAHGSPPVIVSGRVTLARAGGIGSLSARGLPATLVCSSACSGTPRLWVTRTLARALRAPGHSVAGTRSGGLPHGRYVALSGQAAGVKRAGSANLTLAVPRAVRTRLLRLSTVGVRVAGLARGPGTAARALTWPLVLPR